MNVVYSDQHRTHDPPYQFNVDHLGAYPECARRMDSILDMDYHHGNGTQSIFYEDPNVFTVSLHADPDRAYPFFPGRSGELGAGAAIGRNRNFPLPPGVEGDFFLDTLALSLDLLASFDPDVLIVSVGFDTFKEDALGDFELTLDDFTRIGERIAAFGRPTVLIQEGGYDLKSLGRCVCAFLSPFENVLRHPRQIAP